MGQYSGTAPSGVEGEIMEKLLERFDDFRRWLPSINIIVDLYNQRLLFAVANLDECFITRTPLLATLREVKMELLWAVYKFRAGRSPRHPIAPGLT